MIERQPTKAVIYCRVSSKKQVTDGSGLDSQEHRCRAYAKECGLNVEAVFPDDISGGGDFMNRPGMVDLLQYLDDHSEENFVVIFDDLKRYSRDTEFHLRLRREMSKRGAIRICLNFTFEDTPEGKFFETIVAATGTLEREQNQRQVVQKMQARMEKGFYVFAAPVGYRYEKQRGCGRILVRDEPAALAVQEALEGYASGRFQSQAEVRRFLQESPDYPKGRSGYVHQSRVQQILDRQIYAGYISYEPWGIGLTKGQHEPLISMETWQAIQQRKNGACKAPARKNLNVDFPLRGFVSCGSCNQPYTAAWSKGRSKQYPYYLCDTKGCSEHRKSVRKEKIEGDFEALLTDMTPGKELFIMLFEMMKDQWNDRIKSTKGTATRIKRELRQIEQKTSDLVDLIVDAKSPSLVPAYEKRLNDLETQKAVLESKLDNSGAPNGDFKEIYRTAITFLANPLNLWNSERIEDKRAVLKMVFADRLCYLKNKGYRTADFTLPFKALEDFSGGDFKVVGPEGLEPPTNPL